VRRTDDHVARPRPLRDKGREGVDGELVPFARTHETEAQDHVTPLEPEQRLDRLRVGERQGALFVLERHEVDTAADCPGDSSVIRALIPPDPVMDGAGMRGAPARGQQGDDLMDA
jgi:hypothetical protein